MVDPATIVFDGNTTRADIGGSGCGADVPIVEDVGVLVEGEEECRALEQAASATTKITTKCFTMMFDDDELGPVPSNLDADTRMRRVPARSQYRSSAGNLCAPWWCSLVT